MKKKYPEKVYLHIYDLSPINSFLSFFGFGIYHSGLEVYGREYTFAGGGGIFDTKPLEVIESEGVPLRETIELGEIWHSQKDIDDIIYKLRTQFGPNDYNLVTKNCNNFSSDLCKSLLNKDIPDYVNRLANWGRIFEPIITWIMNKIMDVSSNNFSYKSINHSNSSFIPFSGKGQKLNYQ